ncbi:unnamed protein product [Urochloa humidicola]
MDLIVEDSFVEFSEDNIDQASEVVPKSMDLIVEDSFVEFSEDNIDPAGKVDPKALDLIVEDSFDEFSSDNSIQVVKDSREESLAERVADHSEGEGNKTDDEEPEADINTLLYDRYEAAMKEVIEENAAMHEENRKRVREDILRICVPLFF